VLQFDHARGYGFVAADDGGEDVFLHASVFDGDPDALTPGIKVEFKVMAGDRGRKAFAAHYIDDEPDPGDKPVAAAQPNPAAQANPSVMAVRKAPGKEGAPCEETMCDLLSQTELEQELTELLMGNVPTLTGQQILEIRQGVLDCARKHGWVDI
jgi:cold shock CspA family protein